MAFEKDPDELGALWARTYACKKTGDTLTRLTGTVNGVEVVCWPIDKQHDNQPTYRVKRSRPRVGGTASAPAPTPVTDDEIPF
jgi:hypothetical protein|tara:strand:- start:727 stop:975 length:249 start_codon:yes stop_codon:yes gene_type:complete